MNINRNELIRTFVLMIVADDYEYFDKVSDDVSERGRQCGLAVNQSEVMRALLSLIEAGLAKAYRYHPAPINSFEEIQGAPPQEEISNRWSTYFWITPKGQEILASNRERYWPFDDEGLLRKDWPNLEG